MGGQITRIVEDRFPLGLAVFVDLAPEIKQSELFVDIGRHGVNIRVTRSV
jgi:hypothetical protein